MEIIHTDGSIDWFALKAVAEFLQVARPVKVKMEHYLPPPVRGEHWFVCWWGRYRYHAILISDKLRLADANATLCHEMVHAAQLERFIRRTGSVWKGSRAFHKAYWAEINSVGYARSEFEIEANRYMDHVMPAWH